MSSSIRVKISDASEGASQTSPSPCIENDFSYDIIRCMGSFFHPFQLAQSRLISKRWKTILSENSMWEKIASSLGINTFNPAFSLQIEVKDVYRAFQKQIWIGHNFLGGCSSVLQKGEFLFLKYPNETQVFSVRSARVVDVIKHMLPYPYTIHLCDQFLIKAYNEDETTLTCEVFSTRMRRPLFKFTQTSFQRNLLPQFFLITQNYLVHRTDSGLCVRNLSGEELYYLPHSSPILFLYLEGKSLMTVDGQGILRIWDVQKACCIKTVMLDFKNDAVCGHLLLDSTQGIHLSQQMERLFFLKHITISDKIYLFFEGSFPKYCVAFELDGRWNSNFFPNRFSFPEGGREYTIVRDSRELLKSSPPYCIKLLENGTSTLSIFDSGVVFQTLLANTDFKDFKFLEHNLILWSKTGDYVSIQDLNTGKNLTSLSGHVSHAPQPFFSIEGKLVSVIGSQIESDSINPQLPLHIMFPMLGKL